MFLKITPTQLVITTPPGNGHHGKLWLPRLQKALPQEEAVHLLWLHRRSVRRFYLHQLRVAHLEGVNRVLALRIKSGPIFQLAKSDNFISGKLTFERARNDQPG